MAQQKQVATVECEGGTLLMVEFPIIGQRFVVFGDEIIHPETGKVYQNKTASMLRWSEIIVSTLALLGPLTRRRCDEWESYISLCRLALKGKFEEAFDLAYAAAK